MTRGARESTAWLALRGLDALHVPAWYVHVTLHGIPAGTLDLEVFPHEWCYAFELAGCTSTLRVTDIEFVHGRDDHNLLGEAPSLDRFLDFVARLEQRHAVRFDRTTALVHSNLTRAAPIVRAWLNSKAAR